LSALWTIEATAEQTSTTCEIEEQAGYVYMHIKVVRSYCPVVVFVYTKKIKHE